ncbi:MAG TPA: HD domain-containing phosphohydrolase [Solirubrobacteraceae bacterium]|nr:HD domain-containing phosphohydrolase [Solirubrobacteraceae bacterium]
MSQPEWIREPGPAPAEILVVDDDEQGRGVLSRILQGYGYVCHVASDVGQARRVLELMRPDLVLSDVRMPGESGIALLEYIRTEFPFLPVVLVSGFEGIDVALGALELGAYGWVNKPFDANQVLIAVANALIRASLEQQSRDYEERLEQAVRFRTAELGDTVQKLERSEIELRRVTQDTILALTRAIERRDIETAHHIERVSLYATVLARRLGLPHDECELIREASPMHDVGKVGIPDGILLKPGPVTEAEFDVIKQHVALGHSILSRSEQPLLQLAADLAETHHERWDGTGYLQGLHGEEIPLAGRITAIADTFDALVSRRVYKPPVPVDSALAVIREGRGKQFDPQLVDLFLACRADLTAIVADHPDH